MQEKSKILSRNDISISYFPRHRMPVFFPLYGEVGSSLLRFNPATISRPLRTSTSRPFFVCSVPRGIPRFSFFCSPALNTGFPFRSLCRLRDGVFLFSFFCSPALNAVFSLCIFRASLREPLLPSVSCAREFRERVPPSFFVHSAV